VVDTAKSREGRGFARAVCVQLLPTPLSLAMGCDGAEHILLGGEEMLHQATLLRVTAVAVLILAGAANAGLIATDLNTGGIDTGFSGGWSGSNNVFITIDPDLTYANYFITQSGTTQNIYTSNAGPDRQDKRDLATAMSGDIWFSILVHVPAGGNYAGLTFNRHGADWNPIDTDARILMGASQLQVGFNGGTATTGTGTFSADTTQLLLGQMNVAAGNDTLSVWVSPDLTAVSGPGDLPAANFTSTTVDFTDSIANLGVAGSKGAAAEVYIDAIRLSDTETAFEDVTGVPEPTTFALVAFGLLGLARRRRGA